MFNTGRVVAGSLEVWMSCFSQYRVLVWNKGRLAGIYNVSPLLQLIWADRRTRVASRKVRTEMLEGSLVGQRFGYGLLKVPCIYGVSSQLKVIALDRSQPHRFTGEYYAMVWSNSHLPDQM